MSRIKAPAAQPCGSCPYARRTPSGVWAVEEYEKLPEYDGETFEQPPGVFMCHRQDGRLCAGWVGCHDMNESLAVRILGTTQPELAGKLLDYTTTTPLFTSGAEAAAHGVADVKDPSPAAQRIIDKLRSKLEG